MSKSINVLLFTCTLFYTSLSFGQILNVEKFRLEEDTSNVWIGNINFGLSMKKQQTQVLSLGSNYNVAYLSDLHSYMFLGNFNLIQVENTDVISEGYGHLRFNFLRKRKLSLEQFNQLQYDKGRGMIFRGLVGADLRVRLISNDNLNISANTGAMYETEEWRDENGTLIPNNNLKSTSNLTVRWNITESLAFMSITYYQARFDRFFRPRLITDTSFQIQINERFSFRTQYVATYDDDPVVDQANFIYSLENKLVITL